MVAEAHQAQIDPSLAQIGPSLTRVLPAMAENLATSRRPWRLLTAPNFRPRRQDATAATDCLRWTRS